MSMSARKTSPRLDSSLLRSRLKLKHLQSEALLTTHHPEAVKQLLTSGVRPGDIRDHARRLLTSGIITASLFLTPGQPTALASLPDSAQHEPLVSPLDLNHAIQEKLSEILPPESVPLTPDQEQQVSGLLHQIYGLHATAHMEGNQLNTSYGFMGAEQHLPRYPGDSINAHETHQASGMTPGRGAWGYFAPSKQALTPELVQMEKYYVAVQTLYLPDWSVRLAYLRDWYKFRKVVVVNPANGRLIVAAVADSGPAAWTGKSFGGSPEVMDYLRLKDGKAKTPVVLFFVDDAQNQVPFGPLEYNLEASPPLLSSSII